MGTRKGSGPVGRRIAKANLPAKPCQGCGRSFAWRKKWERCWDEVRFCSDRCRRERRPGPEGG
jgi:hypothetical protein